jgi:hypothetical protein
LEKNQQEVRQVKKQTRMVYWKRKKGEQRMMVVQWKMEMW